MANRRGLLTRAGALTVAAALTGSGAGARVVVAEVAYSPGRFEAGACPGGYSEGGLPDYFSEEGDADFVTTFDRLGWMISHQAAPPVTRHVMEESRVDASGRETKTAVYVDRSGVTMGQIDLVRAKYGWQVASFVNCASAEGARLQSELS